MFKYSRIVHLKIVSLILSFLIMRYENVVDLCTKFLPRVYPQSNL